MAWCADAVGPGVIDLSPLRLGVVAGEASGDLLAGLLLKGLRTRWPALTASGIGGPRMAAEGFEALWPHDRLAVFGYVDALGRLPELLRIRRLLAQRLIEERPAAFIGVDAPDFNFGLETRLRAAGIRTVHFVCPSIWAWRGGRAKHMARSCDRSPKTSSAASCLRHSHPTSASASG